MQRRDFIAGIGCGLVALHSKSLLGGETTSRWPCWRGPSRNSQTDSNSWPQSLDEPSLVLDWEMPLDDGYSGPIVDAGQLFLTETKDKKSEAVIALSVKSGEQHWRQEWEGSMTVPFFAKRNGDWIRSTPACNETTVFAAGMRDVLVALDRRDGSEVWRVDFPAQVKSPLPSFGFVCSPLVREDQLFVQAGAACYCLDPATGSIRWKSLSDEGGMNGSAFSSPILVTIDGTEQLLVQTRTDLCGLNPLTGEKLWGIPIEAFRGMNILTPTVWNDQIFTSSYGGKAWLYSVKKQSQGTWGVEKVWENKVQGYMSSPVIVGDHLYMHLRNQRVVCIDLGTGKETWTSRPFGEYWSMITNGKQILALDQKGILYMLDANPQSFQIVSERKVSENESWAHLALAEDRLFVRHQRGIKVFRWS